jgi:predicted RNase H-like HicB family nuclease
MPKKATTVNGGNRGGEKASAATAKQAGKLPRLKVKVMIYPAEEGGFWAQLSALPGCITEGETREELLANLREALQAYLLSSSGAFEPEPGGQEEVIEL